MRNSSIILCISILFLVTTNTMRGQTNKDSSITYIHREKASFMSKSLQSMFGLFGVKRGGALIKKVNKSVSTEVPSSVPRTMLKKYHVEKVIIANKEVWTIKPKENPSEKLVLYLHGGAYVATIKKYHWKFAEQLLLKTNATIVLPDYPLAPTSTCENAMDFIAQVYQELLKKHSPENIALIGDSSGGGLALGFALVLSNEGKPQPNQVILLSPWLDVTMSNEDILEIDKDDKILGIEPLQMAGKAFAGDLDLKDYRLSPIYGDFSELRKISVFIGTHDLFVADSRKLKSLTKASAVPMNYFEYPKMFHGWFILTGMKESKVALDQISSLII